MSDSRNRSGILRHLSFIFIFVSISSASSQAQQIFDEMLGRYLSVYDSTCIWPDGKGGFDYTRQFISEVVLDEQGRSVLSRPATPVLGKYDRITISGYTRLASGETLPIDTSDMVTRALPGDRRWIFVNFRRAEPGAVLHFEWLLSSKEATIAGKRFLGRTVPVGRAEIVITIPETWAFNFAMSGGAIADQNRIVVPSSSGPARVSYSWIAINIPGLIKEEFSPPVERMIACLYYSFYYDSAWTGPDSNQVNWAYLALLYGQQLRTFSRAASRLDQVADSLAQLSFDKKKLAEMGYEWLGAHFKATVADIALSNNINEALSLGRGTQAEATAILLELFSKLGIRASPYLISTHDVGDPIMQVPALFWFDRMLVVSYAGDDTTWIDPYYQSSQIGILPFEDQGAVTFELASGNFITAPIPDYHVNGKAIHLKLDFDSNGGLQGEATEIYSGALIPEISAFLQELEQGERQSPWERKLAKSFPGSKIVRFVVIPPDSAGQAFKVGYSFTTGPLVRPFANRAYIPMDLLGRWADLPALPGKNRQFPIELRRPRFELERITLKISPPFEIDFLPSNYSENTEIGELYSVARGEKNTVTITRGFGLKKPVLPISEYGSLRKFLAKARTEADKHIILRRVE